MLNLQYINKLKGVTQTATPFKSPIFIIFFYIKYKFFNKYFCFFRRKLTSTKHFASF